MVLDAIDSLATGFEGCEKKLEIDFNLPSTAATLRNIPRHEIDFFLSEAKCTIISVQHNRDFDAYVLSESSLFIYPSKILLKTCGTTLLLKCLSPLLESSKKIGAEPDFLQYSRSNFIFPSKQHFPHRGFNEETEYLNSELGVTGQAFILGSLNGARWHLYIWDFNKVDSDEYKQQTLEIIMFNLDQTRMKTFYNALAESNQSSSNNDNDSNNENGNTEQKSITKTGLLGYPCNSGPEATVASGIDKLLPGSLIDSNLFNPCGYSCNGCVSVESMQQYITTNSLTTASGGNLSVPASPSSSAAGSKSLLTDPSSTSSLVGKQGKHQQAYFTIHITPEPECSFVSFETNAVLPNYTSLVRSVVNTFKPGSFCVSLFVDGLADVGDSRSGLLWNCPGYKTVSTTHQAFAAGYNATCSQFEALPLKDSTTAQGSDEYGTQALDDDETSEIVKLHDSGAISAAATIHSTAAATAAIGLSHRRQSIIHSHDYDLMVRGILFCQLIIILLLLKLLSS